MEGKGGLVAGAGAVERHLDRLPGACEHGKDAVSERLRLNASAAVVPNDGPKEAVQLAGLRPEGGVAEALGEGGGVGDVEEEIAVIFFNTRTL